ncbi:MAG: hypothetical protein OXU64_02965 [Gemmatimonadota bacterium]|nr:hypothetical protein [Deltaproteobacteria bacterium]MDE2973674.1 hypothetical protein [Gemmatimonadota bacterium]
MIDALRRIEAALDPYAPYMLIAMFLWLIGGCLYEALSWAVNRPAWKAKNSGGSERGERRGGGPAINDLEGTKG